MSGKAGVDLILPASPFAAVEWITGQYYDTTNAIPASSQGAVACLADTIYTVPFWVPITRAIDRLSIAVTTQASAGNKARLGIYLKSSTGSPLPDGLLLDAGEVAIDAIASVAATIALTLSGSAWYHLAFHPQANCSITGDTPVGGYYGAGGALSTDGARNCAIMAHAYGALPATFVVGSYSAAVRRVQVRAA